MHWGGKLLPDLTGKDFTAPLAASTPNNDLNLWKTLVCYQKENPNISKTASSKFAGNLLQVVHNHRHKFPECKKELFMAK